MFTILKTLVEIEQSENDIDLYNKEPNRNNRISCITEIFENMIKNAVDISGQRISAQKLEVW